MAEAARRKRTRDEAPGHLTERLEELEAAQWEGERRKEQLRARVDELDRCRRIVIERSAALEEVYASAEASRDYKPVCSQTATAFLVEVSRATGMPWPLPDLTPEEWAGAEILRRKEAAAEQMQAILEETEKEKEEAKEKKNDDDLAGLADDVAATAITDKDKEKKTEEEEKEEGGEALARKTKEAAVPHQLEPRKNEGGN